MYDKYMDILLNNGVPTKIYSYISLPFIWCWELCLIVVSTLTLPFLIFGNGKLSCYGEEKKMEEWLVFNNWITGIAIFLSVVKIGIVCFVPDSSSKTQTIQHPRSTNNKQTNIENNYGTVNIHNGSEHNDDDLY